MPVFNFTTNSLVGYFRQKSLGPVSAFAGVGALLPNTLGNIRIMSETALSINAL